MSVRAFPIYCHILQILLILPADSKGPDHTVLMGRLALIWGFAIHIRPEDNCSIGAAQMFPKN